MFPEIDEQIRAELEEPQPLAERSPRADDAWAIQRRGEYEATLRRLRAAGLSTERKDTEIRIYGHQ